MVSLILIDYVNENIRLWNDITSGLNRALFLRIRSLLGSGLVGRRRGRGSDVVSKALLHDEAGCGMNKCHGYSVLPHQM